ncbi:MAG: hypothetical protein OSJ55_02275 [Bacteroidales bacterium]|nr:hypothetical protein [Bacteroidales bacterium]
MKDTLITANAKRRELWIIAGCFIAACLMNVYAIVTYHRPWTEFFSQIGYVIVISLGIYAVQWIVRLIVLAVIRIFRSLSR